MGCKCGNVYTLKNGQLVCKNCGHVSLYQPKPSYEELMKQVYILRKTLEDICECQNNRDELIETARTLLQTL